MCWYIVPYYCINYTWIPDRKTKVTEAFEIQDGQLFGLYLLHFIFFATLVTLYEDIIKSHIKFSRFGIYKVDNE